MHYFPRDPIRPPDWRWKNALQGIPPKRLQKYCDPTTLALAHWLKRHGTDPGTWKEPGAPLVGLREAAQLEAAGGVTRDALQAWLLTGLNAGAIADRMGMSAAAIRTYGIVFYDCGPRAAIQGILRRAVGTDAWAERAPTLAEVWKYLAFSGGPYVLEVILADHFSLTAPLLPDRALTAQLLRSSVMAFAEGLRSPLELREVLSMVEHALPWMQTRSIPFNRDSVICVRLLRQINGWQHGPTRQRKPAVTPVPGVRADEAEPDHADAASPESTYKHWRATYE